MHRFEETQEPIVVRRDEAVETREIRRDVSVQVPSSRTLGSGLLLMMFVAMAITFALMRPDKIGILFPCLAVIFAGMFLLLHIGDRGSSHRESGAEERTMALSPAGLSLRLGSGGFGPIPWDTIERVDALRFPFPMVRLRLRRDRQAQVRELLGKEYARYWYSDGLAITAVGFELPPDALVAEVAAYRQRYGAL